MSLAGVESTMLSPAETSHYLLTENERLSQGITNELIRFSVGIENKKDIIFNNNYSPLVKPVTSQNEIPKYNLNKKSKNNPKKIEPNSAYILARMEKVNFFRDYFYKKAKN